MTSNPVRIDCAQYILTSFKLFTGINDPQVVLINAKSLSSLLIWGTIFYTMRWFICSFLMIVAFMGLSLNAQDCLCSHAGDTNASIEAVPCCQELSSECCLKHSSQSVPSQPFLSIIPQVDSIYIARSTTRILSKKSASQLPQTVSTHTGSHPPPLRSQQYRCHVQSWLI